MSFVKRIAALTLCLCMLCSLPISVHAADTVTLDDAVVIAIDDNGVTVRVVFSAPVKFKSGNVFTLMTGNASAGCSATNQQMWKHTTTGVDEDEGFATTYDLNFPYCPSATCQYKTNHKAWWGVGDDENGYKLPDNGIYLYMNDFAATDKDTNSLYLSEQIIVGVNGERLERTAVEASPPCNKFYVKLTTYQPDTSNLPITLNKAAVVAADENGFIVEATFSEPVHLNKNFWVMSTPHQASCGDGICQCATVLGVDYVGDTQGTGYSDTLHIYFDYCQTPAYKEAHRALWLDEDGNYKVPDSDVFANGAYLFVNDFGANHVKGSGLMSTSVISGLNNKAVAATNEELKGASNEYGELYIKLKDEIPVKLTGASVVDVTADGVTVKATFSAPVRVTYRQANAFCLVATSAGGGCNPNNDDQWQMWTHSNIIYCNPILNANGEECSKELMMTFDYCNDRSAGTNCTNANHAGKWFNGEEYVVPEAWLYLDDSPKKVAVDTGYMSKDVIVGINGAPVERMAVSGSSPYTSKIYAQAIDDRDGTGGVDIGDPFIADETTTYSFMNADTGRELAVNGNTEFKLVGQGSNKYAIMVGDAYLDLTGTAPALSVEERIYIIRPCAYDRYQILYNAKSVTDTDDGTDNTVTLGMVNEANPIIASGWYLTKAGESKPLRILPLGDSITFGIGDAVPQKGWRDNLSAQLDTQLDRYVFVGSQVSEVTTLDQAVLLRHEGNPGWTIKDRPSANEPGVTVNGIYKLAEGLVNKYAPDITLMMIGTNDLYHNAFADANKKIEQEDIDNMLADYEDLIQALTHGDERQTVFCSTITPTTSGTIKGQETLFNAAFPAFIQKMAQTYPVVLNDNYAALAGDNVADYLTDGTHLTEAGNVLIAQTYADSIARIYNSDGTKKTVQDLMDAAGESGTVYLNADAVVDGELTVPAGVTLDLNGWSVAAESMVAYGRILDSSNGEGAIVADKGTVLLTANGNVMALYDTQDGCYRLYTCEAKHKSQVQETRVRFGLALVLGGETFNEKAYKLLSDPINADCEIVFAFTYDNGTDQTELRLPLSGDILNRYYQTLKKNAAVFDTYYVIANVNGINTMSEGATLTCEPVFSADACADVIAAVPQTYTHTVNQ